MIGWARAWGQALRADVAAPVVLAPLLALPVAGVLTYFLGAQYGMVVVVLPLFLLAVARSRMDAATAMIALSLIILLWPSPLRVAPLGAVGTPATIGGGICTLLWVVMRLKAFPSGGFGLQPVRYAAYFMALSTVASLFAAYLRTTDPLESRAADRGLIVMVASLGLMVFVADCMPSMERLLAVIRAIVLSGTGVAGLGIIQFVTGLDIPAMVAFPGFQRVISDWKALRSGFTRILSTTGHPIELSVVLAMILPLSLYLALSAHDRKGRRRWWACAAVLIMAIPMTVSRTGVVGIAVGILLTAVGWTWRQRVSFLLAAIPGLGAMRLAFKGLMGTLLKLFTEAGGDPSVDSRQAAADVAMLRMGERPIFGRGFATFIPSRYRFMDDQYLTSLIETGVVGVVALAWLFLTGIAVARGARMRLTNLDERNLAQALCASIAVAACTSAFYDSFGFSTSRSLAMLLIGCAGAMWRFGRQESLARAAVQAQSVPPVEQVREQVPVA